MKVLFKRLSQIHQFSESFIKTEEALKYPLFVEKLVGLNEKIIPAIQEQSMERSNLIIGRASVTPQGDLMYSPVSHSEFPYQYTPENLSALKSDLMELQNECQNKEYDIEVKEEDMVGKNDTTVIPTFLYPMLVSLFKDLLICPCCVGLDGNIDRSEEKINAIKDNFNPAAKKEMAKS